ncbi:hypothetical protein KSP40_PGU022030 [Platanthera guangdongensis]|uniref:WRKY domain-containing protein n=1 Tax=Platanthera guangdongensis TaxID=2320717 RepID=A0ABR2MMG1_9ASPA
MSHQQALTQVTTQAAHSHAQNNSMAKHPSLVDDSYNWRKYGQKQDKGGDIQGAIINVTTQNVQPRRKSNVPLMEVTEIIYKGQHITRSHRLINDQKRLQH